MITTPNLQTLREEALQSLDKEYDLEKSLNRYGSVTPELLEFVTNLGLNDKDGAYALFVSDYILTSSEVPYGISDEDRRTDIATMFTHGLNRKSADVLLKVFYLANKTHSIIRRSDVFMAGRGVFRNASLLTLKDIFIDAYLEICKELLGEGSCGWELALLAGAMKKTLPSKEYEAYKSAPKHSETDKLFPFVWKLLTEYNTSAKTEVNDQVVIPNIDKTSTLMGLGKGKDLQLSSWQFPKIPTILKDNQGNLNDLQEFICQSDDSRPFIYFRGSILKSDQHLFLVRDAEGAKPFFMLKSSVDEINVTEINTLLKKRSLDVGTNTTVLTVDKKVTEVEETVEKEISEEKEIQVEKEIEVESKPEPEPVSESKPEPEMVHSSQLPSSPPKKKGFFGKILGIFKKEDSTPSTPAATSGTSVTPSKPASPKQKKVSKPRTEKKKVTETKTITETRKVQEKVKVKKELDPPTNIPNYVSYALGIVAVGDLNLFQIFDTIRESNYIFSGVLHSDFKNNSSTFYAAKSVDNPKALTSILDGLDVAIEKVMKHFDGTEMQVMPKEILFKGRVVDTNFVIVFEGNEDHLVGIMGSTYIKDDSLYSGEDEGPETFQRRTLKMRTNQLLNTLKSVHRFDEVFIRVLGEELLKSCQEHKFEHAILSPYS